MAFILATVHIAAKTGARTHDLRSERQTLNHLSYSARVAYGSEF